MKIFYLLIVKMNLWKNIGYIYKYYFQKDRLEFYFILLPCTIHHEDKIKKKMAPAAGQDFSQLF